MTCVAEGSLRAYRDGLLDDAERLEIEKHLAECHDCRTHAAELAGTAARVEAHLLALELPEGEGVDSRAALSRFKARQEGRREEAPAPLRPSARWWRPVWVAGVVFAIAAVCLSFPPARSLAQKFLETLRVEKVQPVSLDTSLLEGNRGMQQTIEHLISDKMVVTIDEKEQPAGDAAEAGRLAGFRVQLPGGRTDAPRLIVEGQHAFNMTLDRGRLQEIFNQAGRPDLALPASADGAMVAVQIPRAVRAQYGSCPQPHDSAEKGRREAREFKDCVVLVEAPSPAISVPPGLDVGQLAEIGLELTGMSPSEARRFCQTIDWKSTLVLPLPRYLRSYDVVDVNGVPGTLVNNPDSQGPRYALIWVRNGIIYALIGYGDSGEALSLANSLN
jgi:Putative zinc-finger